MAPDPIVFRGEEAPYGAPVVSTHLAEEIGLLTDLRLMATLLYSVAPTAVHRKTSQDLMERFNNRIENLLPRLDPKSEQDSEG